MESNGRPLSLPTNWNGYEKIKGRWRDLNSLIEATCRREIKGKISKEKRYYISNLMLGPENVGNAVRSHWGIENHLRWIMNVIFLEAASPSSCRACGRKFGCISKNVSRFN